MGAVLPIARAVPRRMPAIGAGGAGKSTLRTRLPAWRTERSKRRSCPGCLARVRGVEGVVLHAPGAVRDRLCTARDEGKAA